MPMKALKELLNLHGFAKVSTYIQSGNVVLEANSDPSQRISELIQREFGFRPEIFAFDQQNYQKIVEANPYKTHEGKFVHLFFCKDRPQLDQAMIESLIAEGEQYFMMGKIFYLHAPNGIGRSKLVQKIDACLGAVNTSRNLNTVNKLAGLVANIAS